MQRELEETLEKEREKRIEHTKQMAVSRIMKRDLARGFVGWHEMWEENNRRRRALSLHPTRFLLTKAIDSHLEAHSARHHGRVFLEIVRATSRFLRAAH